MNAKQILLALRNHANEEIRIHKEIMTEAKGDTKHLVKKHLADTKAIHKEFWKDLKNAWKSK
jgi:hypothetical protein